MIAILICEVLFKEYLKLLLFLFGLLPPLLDTLLPAFGFHHPKETLLANPINGHLVVIRRAPLRHFRNQLRFEGLFAVNIHWLRVPKFLGEEDCKEDEGHDQDEVLVEQRDHRH